MAWRAGAQRARDDVDKRIEGIVHRWQPASAPGGDRFDDDSDDRGHDRGEDESARIVVGPWNRPALRALVVIVGALAVVIGYLAWQSRPREVIAAPEVIAVGEPITGLLASEGIGTPAAEASDPPVERSAAEPAPEVVVHVAGLVRRPGLVRLPAGARVADAIDAVGGITGRKAQDTINLARVLVDGEQILVTSSVTGAPAAGSSQAGGTSATSTVIDLNAATLDQLDALPGVGPVLADRILTWRTSHGRFTSVDELGEVSGIGDAILDRLRSLVRV